MLVDVEPPTQLANAYQHNATKSPLLRLPAELRDEISQYALGDMWITIVCDHKVAKPRYIAQPVPSPLAIPGTKPQLNNGNYRNTQSERKHLLALPLTCRQLYRETHLLPYSRNILHFPLSNDLEPCIKSRTLTQSSAVRTIMPPLMWTERIMEGYVEPFTTLFPKLKYVYLDLAAWKNHGGTHAMDVECFPEDVEKMLGCKIVVLKRQADEVPHECSVACSSRLTLH